MQHQPQRPDEGVLPNAAARRGARAAAARWATRSTFSTPPCATGPSARGSPTRSRTSSPSPAARRTRRRVHRGWLAGRHAQGHRVLRPGYLRRARPAHRSLSRSAPPGRPGSEQRRSAGSGAAGLDAPVVTLVAKSDVRHVDGLRTTPEENLAMVSDTVAFLVDQGRRVFLDCEHFFDGYAVDRDYGVRVAEAAVNAGASVVVLCDTNGGMLPSASAGWSPKCWRAPASGSGSTVRTTPVAPWRTPRRGGGRGDTRAVHRQRLRRAPGQRRPLRGDRQSVTKMGIPVLPEGGMAEMVRVSHALADLANIARTPTSPTSARWRSRTRPACTPRPSRSARRCTTTSTPASSATTCAS